MGFTVGEVAKIARVSVRTLHHYDQLGLVCPSHRSRAGYRLYTDGDLDGLQEVLIWRRLGFSLDQITDLRAASRDARRQALLDQRDLLNDEAQRLETVIGLVNRSLIEHEQGVVMARHERFEGITSKENAMSYSDPEIEVHQSKYATEVVQRWGDTDAYKVSTRRAKGYTAEQWAQIKAEGNAHLADFAAAFDAQLAPSSPASVAAAEAARAHIDTWFYPCSKQMHVALGEMYVQDERFTAYYDSVRPGLAMFVRDAILANAETSANPGPAREQG